jgi:hypothetical protein
VLNPLSVGRAQVLHGRLKESLINVQSLGPDKSDLSSEFELEPDSADNLGRVWVVQLAFWRPATLADDEMETSFPERDGRWSQ